MKILLIGNLSIDKIHINNKIIQNLGGGPYYGNKALSYLGIKTKIISSCGEFDINNIKDDNFSIIDIFNENNNEEYGIVSKYSGQIDYNLLKKDLDSDLIIISTIFEDISIETLSKIRNESNAIIALDMQGFMRNKDINKKIVKNKINLDFLKYVDIVKFNNNELSMQFNDDSYINSLEKIKNQGPKIVILTKGKEGVEILDNGLYKFSGEEIKAEHFVGAGDMFLAFFSYFYVSTRDTEISGKMALENLNKKLKK
jgi:hypothetical protein